MSQDIPGGGGGAQEFEKPPVCIFRETFQLRW